MPRVGTVARDVLSTGSALEEGLRRELCFSTDPLVEHVCIHA